MINQRIFSANIGDISTGQAGPDAIEQDIDNLLANDQELLGITGSKANLTTDDKTNLVAAINEHETQINTLAAEKADKVQPNWINATLQNGATGTLLFRRNQIGQLEIKTSGNLAFGTITQATVITTLPGGYRPTVETVIMVYNTATNRGIPFLTITSSGNIIICADSGIAAGQNTRFSAVCL